MPVIVISDIFGRTPALQRLCETLSPQETIIEIIDPYGGIDPSFKSEALAYEYFMEQVGLDKYNAIIERRLIPANPDTFVIGFSVGATAAWCLSQKKSLSHIKKAIFFYSSQIRYFMDIQPTFEVEFIFPLHEPHYDVDDIIQKLVTTPRVSCKKASGNHGFMNELSKNFNTACCTQYTQFLLNAISAE